MTRKLKPFITLHILRYVFKPSPRTAPQQGQPQLSEVRRTFIRKIVKDATEGATKMYQDACEKEILQQILLDAELRDNTRLMPIQTIDSDDESGLSEDDFSKDSKERKKLKKKKKKKKRKRPLPNSNVTAIKNVGILTKPITFRRVGAYITTVGEEEKMLLSSKGVFDIHNDKKPNELYGKNARNLKNEKLEGIIKRRQLSVLDAKGKATKIVHLVR